jgi:hypothetical protein
MFLQDFDFGIREVIFFKIGDLLKELESFGVVKKKRRKSLGHSWFWTKALLDVLEYRVLGSLAANIENGHLVALDGGIFNGIHLQLPGRHGNWDKVTGNHDGRNDGLETLDDEDFKQCLWSYSYIGGYFSCWNNTVLYEESLRWQAFDAQ